MKREGRQHGMVRTYPTSSAPCPKASQFNSTRTARGAFAKVSSKPTNHSKFTGKCGRPMCHECHVTPPSTSKDKAKGAHRIRSSSGTRLSGFSATSVLNYLDSDECVECCYESDNDSSRVEESDYEISYHRFEIEEVKNGINGECHEDLSFSDVGFIWEVLEDGDEDWYVV